MLDNWVKLQILVSQYYFETSRYLLLCHSWNIGVPFPIGCGGGGGGGQGSHIKLKGLPLSVVKNADSKAINSKIWVAFVCLKS